jgi:RNA polymerase sigma factor (sigma-70 family)
MRVRVIARIKNENFYSARIAAGFPTLVSLSKASGITKGTLGYYENFKSCPRTVFKEFNRSDTGFKRAENLLRLEELLGKKIEELFPPEYGLAVSNKIITRIEFVRDQLYLPTTKELLLLPTPEEEGPETLAIKEDLRKAVLESFKSLTSREVTVLKLRFGIDESGEHTLDEVGDILKLSRERIRQIEAKALRKLKHPRRGGRKLKTFLDSS